MSAQVTFKHIAIGLVALNQLTKGVIDLDALEAFGFDLHIAAGGVGINSYRNVVVDFAQGVSTCSSLNSGLNI